MKQKLFIVIALLTTVTQMAAQSYRAANWWNTPPEDWQFFAGADVAFPETGFNNLAYGINVGFVKTFGFYGRAVMNGSPISTDDNFGSMYSGQTEPTNFYLSNPEYELRTLYATGKIKRTFQAFTAGAMLRLWCPIYLHVGAGIAKHQTAYELENGAYGIYRKYDGGNEFVMESGLSLRINNLMLHTNYMFLDNISALTVGASYCF